MNGKEIYVLWRDLLNAGARITFSRVIYDARHNITGTWADVHHPADKYPPIRFRPTHNCDSVMTARVDDVPHAMNFIADLGVNFKTQTQTR